MTHRNPLHFPHFAVLVRGFVQQPRISEILLHVHSQEHDNKFPDSGFLAHCGHNDVRHHLLEAHQGQESRYSMRKHRLDHPRNSKWHHHEQWREHRQVHHRQRDSRIVLLKDVVIHEPTQVLRGTGWNPFKNLNFKSEKTFFAARGKLFQIQNRHLRLKVRPGSVVACRSLRLVVNQQLQPRLHKF